MACTNLHKSNEFNKLYLIQTKMERRRFMGKGDRRTRRGKIFRGSYGKSRPKKKNQKKEK